MSAGPAGGCPSGSGGSGGGDPHHTRCLCAPRCHHAPPCHHLSATGLLCQSRELCGAGGQVGSCGSRVDVGKRWKPRLRFMLQGKRELSSCHQSTVLSWCSGSSTAVSPEGPWFLYSPAQKLVCLILGSSSTEHGFG